MIAPVTTPPVLTLEVALERVMEAACHAWDTHHDRGGQLQC